MKKILLITNTSWNILNFRIPLLNNLKKDYEILVAAPEDQYTHEIIQKNIPYVPLNALKPKSQKVYDDLRLLRQLYRLYKREQADMVLHFTIKPNIYGSFVAQRLGIPSIPTLTGLGYTAINAQWSQKIALRLYQLAFKRLPLVMVHNADDLNWLIDRKIISPSQGQVVPGSGIDTNYFEQAPLTFEPENSRIFLMAGRLLYDKGVLEYASAAKMLTEKYPHWQFRIAGSLDAANPAAITGQEWKRILADSPLQYLGLVKDIRTAIRAAHVMVLPSYREGLPRFLLEGMACGRPLVATDVPGCRQLVLEGKNGYLAKVKDVPSLATTIESIGNLSVDALIQMGATSRAIVVQEYSEEKVASVYMNAIKELF